MHDVIIVGGGVIGLSAARELALLGRKVLLLDLGSPREATSWAAAGMLAPQSEADASSPFFDLCLASARLYRAWAGHLCEESGVDAEYVRSGLLFVASTEDSLSRLRRSIDWQQSAGLKAELLNAEEAAKLEPALTLPLTGAVAMPDECHVTPRLLLDAVRGACAANGVEIRSGQRVLQIESVRDRVSGVRTSTELIPAENVVIACGVRSPEIGNLRPAIPVTPRKGQILSLASSGLLFSRMIRWEHAYFVPRRNGELIVGATNEDAGFDRSLTPAGVGALLGRAQQLSSKVAALPINEMWTGLRPATPDGLPVIGRAQLDGLIYANGHYRNGILLAPITAESVAALVENRPGPVALDAFSPARFAV